MFTTLESVWLDVDEWRNHARRYGKRQNVLV